MRGIPLTESNTPQPDAAQDPPFNGLTMKVILGLLVSAALLAAAWFGTFSRVWVQWFPAWWQRDIPLLDRLTGGDSYYTHGLLVPVISLAVAFYIYTRVGAPVKRTTFSSLFGWAMFTFFPREAPAVYVRKRHVRLGFALLGVIGGLVIIWAAGLWLKPTGCRCAAVLHDPAAADLDRRLNSQLKIIATDAALWLAIHIFNVPAVQDGSFVLLSRTSTACPRRW